MKSAKLLTLVLLLVGLASFSYVVIMSCSTQESPVESRKFTGTETWSKATIPTGKTEQGAISLSTNYFRGWYRFPTEEQRWQTMTNDSAYYRDIYVGGETYITGAEDGETWTASVVRPDGTTTNWSPVRFYSVYGEDQNCFVTTSWKLCGTTSAYILWYTGTQCAQTGEWAMHFYNDGEQFAEDSFKLLPQIEPGRVPSGSLYNQKEYFDINLHHYDNRCFVAGTTKPTTCDDVNSTHCTIKNLGCFLTATCMILGYYGLEVSPATLNDHLETDSIDHVCVGYIGGDVNGLRVAKYAQDRGVDVYYVGWAPSSSLYTSVCSNGPQLAHVRSLSSLKDTCHHFVTVTGRDEPKSTYLINDPWGGDQIRLDERYYNNVYSMRLFKDSTYNYKADLSGILMGFYSPGELLVIDPDDRRTGLDPLTGMSYSEIPNAAYFDQIIGPPDADNNMESKQLEIMRPETGDYQVVVTGTGSGTYDLVVYGQDAGSEAMCADFLDVPIESGEVHNYGLYFDKTSVSAVTMAGGYIGGRQRPTDVNRFLSYVTVFDATTHLPSGTSNFELLVVYGKTVFPSTFTATLNDQDVSALFSPSSGGYELVSVPLQNGLNELILSITGDTPDRQMQDVDVLEFIVE